MIFITCEGSMLLRNNSNTHTDIIKIENICKETEKFHGGKHTEKR